MKVIFIITLIFIIDDLVGYLLKCLHLYSLNCKKQLWFDQTQKPLKVHRSKSDKG